MHNQPYVGRIALCTRKKLIKSGEIRHFYGNEHWAMTVNLPHTNKLFYSEVLGIYL